MNNELSDAAREARNAYFRKRRKNPKAREADRLYHREWRRRNPEKVKEYQRLYWERRAEKLNQ
jgi:hypothetical protein